MDVHDLKDSVREMNTEDAMALIKKRRLSRHKSPKKKKKKKSSGGGGGGGRRKKAPQTMDEIWKALNSEQQEEMLKKMEEKYGNDE